MSECTKVQYTTEQFALDDIIRIRKKSTRSRQPLRPYYCSKCNFWHTTSLSGPTEKLSEALEEIKLLKIALALYKATSKEELTTIRKDTRVMELRAEIKTLNKRVRQLQKDNSNLISKNIQLNNKLDGTH